jgi:opacity protein-like surface antigen
VIGAMRHGRPPAPSRPPIVVVALAVVALVATPVQAMDGKLGVHIVRMDPNGTDATRYTEPGWGFGVQLTATARSRTAKLIDSGLLAGIAGIEYVNLQAQERFIYDPVGVSVTVERNDQYLGRLYLGPEIGGHGHGLLRPHAGANLALVLYGISYGNGFGDHKTTYGYDFSAGLDFNPWNTVSFDLGARYVKMFGIPAQLSFETAEPIEPAYVQAYLAVAFSLPWLARGVEH